MKHSFLNNLQKCEFKIHSQVFIGDILAKIYKNPNDYYYVVNSDNSLYGHSCAPRTYSGMVRDGYEFYITEEEFELLRDDENMWFVDPSSFIGIIENYDNKPSINITVDENGKIFITKD